MPEAMLGCSTGSQRMRCLRNMRGISQRDFETMLRRARNHPDPGAKAASCPIATSYLQKSPKILILDRMVYLQVESTKMR